MARVKDCPQSTQKLFVPDSTGFTVNAMDGFKEWDIICRALECGWQSILLRAGGIHDSARWHTELPERFFLMPNDYHEAESLVRRIPEDSPSPLPRWTIRSWAEVVHVSCIDNTDVFKSLEPFHIYKEELVTKRFHQNNPPAVWIILLRVYLLPKPWQLEDRDEFGGCRSLVTLPAAPFPLVGEPVLDDPSFARIQDQLDAVLYSR